MRFLAYAFLIANLLPPTAVFAQRIEGEGAFVISGVKVDGNELFSDAQIRGLVRIEKGDRYERYLFDYLLDRGIAAVKAAYYDEGFHEAAVKWTFYKVKPTSRKLKLLVEEGPRAVITDILLAGVSVDRYLAVRENLGIDVGSPLSATAANKAARTIEKYYQDRGYARARADAAVDRESGRVAFKVEEGHIYKVGEIIVAGNERTRPRIVARELEYKFKPDRTYRASKIDESRANIYRTGLYRDLKVEPVDAKGAPDLLDILVIVREDKFKWYKIEPGYSSPDRAALTLGWGHNSIFGNNQRLALEALGAYGFTTKESQFKTDVTYTEPWLFGYRYKGSSTLFYNREILRNYRLWEVGLEPRVTRELTERLEVTGGLNVKKASLDLGGAADGPFVIAPYPGGADLLPDLEGLRSIGSVIFSSSYNSRDDVFNPLAGSYLFGSEETAGVVGGEDFWRVIGDGRNYLRVGPAATMAAHLRGGLARAYGRSKDLTLQEKFFSGGAYSIRGYRERDVGPKDARGDPVGGNLFLTANVELRFQLPFTEGRRVPGLGLNLGNLWAGLFTDAGNVWANWTETRKSPLAYGVGLGLRYNTPVGPLRLDYGQPVREHAAGAPGRFYVAFGHIF